MSTLAGAGCLPTPEIQVPDFSPAPSADAGADSAQPGGPGDLGTTLHWGLDGQGVATDTLRAVWVADAALSQAYAVGHNGLILHRSGGIWKKEQALSAGKPIVSNLYAVAAITPDLVYAVGDAGMILRRASNTWTQEGQELMNPAALFGVTVLSTGEVIVVGDGGLVARRQLSGIYVAEDTTGLSGANLRAVSGSAIDGLYAVGMGAVIAQRVAGKWQLDPFAIDPTDRGNYYAVSQSADGIFVAGEYTRVLRRDVAKWLHEATLVPPPPTVTHFFGLYAAPGELFAIGSTGTIQHRDAASQIWSVEPSGVTASLYGIVGASAKSAVTVGEQGTLLRRM